jgi:hypothetical protein
MNSSNRRILHFWPQRPSRQSTHSSKLHFTKTIDRRVWFSAPPHLSPPPLQAEARVVRQTCLSPPVAVSITPEATSVALHGRICRPPWSRLSPPVAASVADHPALKRSYLLAPNSDFDDLGHFGKLTQRATQPTKALNPAHNRSK